MKPSSPPLLASIGMLLAIAYSCHAAVIPIFGIEAFHQGDSLDANGSVLRAIDRSGMSIPDSNDPSTWTVSSNAWADDWQGFASPTAGTNNTWAVIDLGAPAASIETMYLWNVQEGITAPGNGQWARGTNEFEVFYATAPTIAPPATSGATTPYDFTSGGWTSAGATVLFRGGGLGDTGQSYDLSDAAGARYIGLKLLSNHGGNRTGFAEIAFTDVVDANAITLGDPVDPPDPPDPPDAEGVIPIAEVFAFHQGDSFGGNGSILRVSDNSINTTADPADPAAWTHSNAWADDWQGFQVPGATENGTWVVLDLGETVSNINSMLLWNVNEASALDRGVNEFIVHTATAPTVAPPVVSGAATPYDFSSGGWTAFGGTRTLAQANGTVNEPVSGTYDLTGIGPTRYLGIQILSNHGGNRVGFAHVVLLSAAGPAQGLEIVEIDVSEYAADRIGITWRSRPGQMYGLNVSSDLTNWLEVSDNLIGEAGQETTTFVDVDSGGAGTPAISEQPRRYYQIFEISN